MSAPVMLRSQYSHLFSSAALPALESLFMHNIALYESNRSKLAQIKSTNRDIYQMSSWHDLEQFNEITEGSEYVYERPKQGASKTLTISKYGLGVSISEEMVDDGKFDIIAALIEKLARSAKESQEVSFMNLFNNGFSSETTPDGVALFSASHTLPSGGTLRNTLSTTADLDPTSLEQALIDFGTQQVGDTGQIYKIQPKFLVVPMNLIMVANELTKSMQKPDTADNNINAVNGFGLQVIASPHIVDTDAWFLVSDPKDNGLRVIERSPIMTKAAGPDVGFHTDSIFYKSRYREKLGCEHPYGLFGVAGA